MFEFDCDKHKKFMLLTILNMPTNQKVVRILFVYLRHMLMEVFMRLFWLFIKHTNAFVGLCAANLLDLVLGSLGPSTVTLMALL